MIFFLTWEIQENKFLKEICEIFFKGFSQHFKPLDVEIDLNLLKAPFFICLFDYVTEYNSHIFKMFVSGII